MPKHDPYSLFMTLSLSFDTLATYHITHTSDDAHITVMVIFMLSMIYKGVYLVRKCCHLSIRWHVSRRACTRPIWLSSAVVVLTFVINI